MKYLEKTMTLRVSECGIDGRWRPGAILTEMQEAAGDHSAAMGCGRETLIRSGLVWVVTRIELHMARYPSYGESLTLRTFHRPHRHRFFPRFFEIRDGEGGMICQASSLWLLMDLQTRQSVSADRLPTALTENGDMPELMPLPGVIEIPDAPEQVIPYRAVYTDLDANGHVNNTKYADWLCNALGRETMTAHPPETMIIHFNNEVRPEQQVEMRLRQDGTQYYLLGLHERGNAFEIGGKLMG